jgi:hypothetical protein
MAPAIAALNVSSGYNVGPFHSLLCRKLVLVLAVGGISFICRMLSLKDIIEILLLEINILVVQGIVSQYRSRLQGLVS